MFKAGGEDFFNASFSSHRAQSQFNANNTLSGLDSQLTQSPFEELGKLYQFAVTCIWALEHRNPTLGEKDVTAERKANREYRGLPPISNDPKFVKGRGGNPKSNEGEIPKSVNAMTCHQKRKAMSVPPNSIAVKCMCVGASSTKGLYRNYWIATLSFTTVVT